MRSFFSLSQNLFFNKFVNILNVLLVFLLMNKTSSVRPLKILFISCHGSESASAGFRKEPTCFNNSAGSFTNFLMHLRANFLWPILPVLGRDSKMCSYFRKKAPELTHSQMYTNHLKIKRYLCINLQRKNLRQYLELSCN